MIALKLAGSMESDATTVGSRFSYKRAEPLAVFLILMLMWSLGPDLLRLTGEYPGSIDQSIWLLIILSLITFLLVTGLCWWLLKHFWLLSGLPSVSDMVLQFNTLALWQQICFFLISFGLLLLAATGTVIAIC